MVAQNPSTLEAEARRSKSYVYLSLSQTTKRKILSNSIKMVGAR